MLSIIALGLLNHYSASRVAPGGLYGKQLVWYGIGLVIFIVTAAVDYRVYERLAPFAYGICVVLLIVLLAAGTRDVKGSRRWFELGGFHLQPSELAKLGVILLLAKLTSGEPQELRARGLPRMLGLLLLLL